jgi:MFS family permease
LFQSLPEDQFLAWGWRIPFLLSIVVVAVGLYVRLRILETPVFTHVKETHTQVQTPAMEVVRSQRRNLLVALGARFSENGNAYIIQTFALTYVATELGVPQNTALLGVLISAALGLFAIPAFGALSDRVGRRPVYLAGSAFVALFAFPFFWMLNTKSTILIWLAIILSTSVGIYAMFSPQAAYFAELFDTRVRYSGASLGYQLSGVLSGAFAPLIATALLASFGGASWPVALYLAALSLVSLVGAYLAVETYRSDIYGERPRGREAIVEG